MLKKRKPKSKLAAILVVCAYPDGQVWPIKHQQWPAIARATRLGLIDANQFLTDSGKALIAKHYAAH